MTPTRKRQLNDLQFKKTVLKWREASHNRSLNDAPDLFQIPIDTVKSFHRKREFILKSDDMRKRMRSARFSALETDVLRLVHLSRSLRLPVTGFTIQTKARSLRTKHNIDADSFSASRGWLHKFLKRNRIENSIRLYFEAGQVDKDKVRDQTVKVSEKLSKYKPEHIYSEDESGFFYQSLPTITYLARRGLVSVLGCRGSENLVYDLVYVAAKLVFLAVICFRVSQLDLALLLEWVYYKCVLYRGINVFCRDGLLHFSWVLVSLMLRWTPRVDMIQFSSVELN